MNWPLIGLVAAAGAVLGVLPLVGFGGRFEGFLWPTLALLSAVRIGLQERHQPFRHGFLAGLLAGAPPMLLRAAFFATYFEKETPGAVLSPSPRLFLLAMTPLIAILSGAILGGLSQLVAHLTQKLHARAMLRQGP